MTAARKRRRSRLTQKEAVFYVLYKRHREGAEDHLPVFRLMGEVWCEELGKWGYVSYECSARASELMRDNPGLLHRTKLRGRSGASFYGYKIAAGARAETILDPDLHAFYRTIKSRMDAKAASAKQT